MNKTLYLYEMKKSGIMLLVFSAIILMYVVCVIWMYDPEMMKSLKQMHDSMPQVMSAAGMDVTSTTLIGFLISYLYGFILLVFPMIFIILRSRNLLAGKVEKKNMASLLAAPVSRQIIVQTQILVIITCTAILIIATTVFEMVFCHLWEPGELNISQLCAINISLFILHFFIGGFCMAISAVCNEASLATGISGGIGAVMFLVQMIRNTQISDTVEKFKYFTFFTLYNPGKIADNVESGIIGIAVLGVLGLLFYFFTVILFEKKDLPI